MRSTSEHLIISCDYGYNWGRADRKLRERMQLLPPGNDEQSIKCHRQRLTLLASNYLIVCQICARTNDLSTLEWMCWIYGQPFIGHTHSHRLYYELFKSSLSFCVITCDVVKGLWNYIIYSFICLTFSSILD